MENLFKQTSAVVIFDSSNLMYYSQFANDDAVIILTPTVKYYLTDARTLAESQSLLPSFRIIEVLQNNYKDIIKELLDGYDDIGYVKKNILYTQYEMLSKLGKNLLDISSVIDEYRSVKSEIEINNIKIAQSITDATYAYILTEIKLGITEKQLKKMLDSSLLRHGGDSLSFDSIVAFGKNTANPHAHATDYALQYGDPITLDFGAKYLGYCSDMTRSLVFGAATAEYITVYNAVLEAQTKAIEALSEGSNGYDIDKLSREILARYGLSECFTHSLGHSLGIDIHEEPRLSKTANNILVQNNVITVEPGIYLPNKFGIRIEDMIIIKKCGVDNLTKSPKTLIIV